jgi:glutathione peroxidase
MEEPRPSVYEFSAPLLNAGPEQAPVRLSQFSGQVLLIVNTASKCGFTPQYAGLEQLYRDLKDRGFAVLAFPSNQFGAQEPGTEAEIGAFCEKNYGVTFPVFKKIDVNGPQTHPLYRFLKHAQPGMFFSERIKWNFTKFLVDRQGNVVRRYAPSTSPQSLTDAIVGLLDSR